MSQFSLSEIAAFQIGETKKGLGNAFLENLCLIKRPANFFGFIAVDKIIDGSILQLPSGDYAGDIQILNDKLQFNKQPASLFRLTLTISYQ